MAGGTHQDAALAARLDAEIDALLHFRPRQPHQYPNLLGGEAAIPYERIFASVARGREAIDLAIGEGLCALEDRDLLMDLGYSKMTDYAREALGLPGSTAREKAKLARELRTRPLLRDAVRSGRLSPRHARELFPVALGDAERPWVALARSLSVRELHRAVERARRREAVGEGTGGPAGASASGEAEALAGSQPGGGESVAPAGGEAPGASRAGEAPAAPPPADPGEERWRVGSIPVRPELRIVLEAAMELAEETLWRGAPAWRQLEALSSEFLGWYDQEEPSAPEPAEGAVPAEELEKALEIVSGGWSWLEAVEPLEAPDLGQMEPQAIHERLKELSARRKGWDQVFGITARAFVGKRVAAELGFADLGHYLRERLGMGRRAVEQRVWLERRLEDLPQLAHAFRRGEVSYEKARLVASVADFDSANQWIRRAAGMTCVELERAVRAAQDAQACARGRIDVRLPEDVACLLDDALRCAARVFAGPDGSPPDRGECLVLVAMHFLGVWGPMLWPDGGPPRRRKIQERDGGWCTAPGCSRPSAQDHHLVYRSRGGGNDSPNQTAMCIPHHLRGVHGGKLRVSGTAPDRLRWELADGTPFGPKAPVEPR